jgi:uncharacterized membrane protein
MHKMYFTVCDECGYSSGVQASPFYHSHCIKCNKHLEANYRIKCNTCNHINQVESFNELKNSTCTNCKYPLSWSFTKVPSSDKTFIPNFIPLKTRFKNALASLALIAYSVYGLIHDRIDIFYGGRRYSSSPKIIAHFTGYWKLIPLFGIIVLIIMLLSVLIDHIDKRPNEEKYQKFSEYCFWTVFIVYILAGFFANSITRL